MKIFLNIRKKFPKLNFCKEKFSLLAKITKKMRSIKKPDVLEKQIAHDSHSLPKIDKDFSLFIPYQKQIESSFPRFAAIQETLFCYQELKPFDEQFKRGTF
jgi:hypothetical protein